MLIVLAIIAAAAIGVLILGTVGVGKTVTSGTQTTICGTKVGVSLSGEPGKAQTVQLLGVTSESLAPGDRARVSALCVVEVVSIAEAADTGQDGAGARVQLRWRLW